MQSPRITERGSRRWMLKGLGAVLTAPLLEAVTGWRRAADGAWPVDRALPAVPRRPRPATLSPRLFRGKVAEAYRIAKDAPELVEQMACYCGCDRSDGHRNNLDCYVDRHAVG
jgi:hypothetical protein